MNEHDRRIIACLAACEGIETAQLEAMNKIAWGALAQAYDAASAIVEAIGFNLLATMSDEDADCDLSNDDCWKAVADAAESATAACAWAREET